MSEKPEQTEQKWFHPSEVMKLHNLKQRKKALQARIAGTTLNPTSTSFPDLNEVPRKRKNPFVKEDENKRFKQSDPVPGLEESADQTLFKLLHQTVVQGPTPRLTSFENILNKNEDKTDVLVVKAQGEREIPLDWALKTKLRLFSNEKFSWGQKMKINEEASGVTGFVRCLTTGNSTKLDISPNAGFHQCCLYWEQPSLPWLNLFPRTTGRVSDSNYSIALDQEVRKSLHLAWRDSLRSLFQLVRTKQSPYFYVCSNTFTILFRAAGISGFSDIHAIITPTTRGFRQALIKNNIEFTLPLKKRVSDQGYETGDSISNEEEAPDEQWFKSMGINTDEIKQINYTQAKLVQRSECQVDNSEQSLVLIEGLEVNGLYNFLFNCKSTVATSGPLAGIPPTLISPVAFNGATLRPLQVRESKARVGDSNVYSLELSGPILPSTIHNLFAINPSDHSISAMFVSIPSTVPFNKLTKSEDSRNLIFDKENLSDCGLNPGVLGQFCKGGGSCVTLEGLKYNADSQTYTWT